VNRRIAFLGLVIVLVGISLMVSPIALYGSLKVNIAFESGVMLLPVGLSIVLVGASAADPTVTTVGGVWGNPDENLMRRAEKRPALDERRRFLPGPKESTNCRWCYTSIAWNEVDCARCGHRRECRGCGRPLFFLAGSVRCAPCVKDEVYCSCPKLKRPMSMAPGARGRAR